MKTIEYKSDSRGSANHGWLDTKHTFSFANYYNPERMHFGALRVFNDDIVKPGMGFGTHPHDNMEIVTIVLDGKLNHKDSAGHEESLVPGEVQFMSAGTGVYHSEYNGSDTEDVNFIQTWVFPKKRDIKPAYGQKKFDPQGSKNSLLSVVSPDGDGGSLSLNQDAWYHLGYFDTPTQLSYEMHGEDHGAFFFLVEGEAEIAGKKLDKRDALGVYETENIKIAAGSDTKLLIIEVPMTF